METTLEIRYQLYLSMLETKYRDIADGNHIIWTADIRSSQEVGNQVPRYSGWKRLLGLSLGR